MVSYFVVRGVVFGVSMFGVRGFAVHGFRGLGFRVQGFEFLVSRFWGPLRGFGLGDLWFRVFEARGFTVRGFVFSVFEVRGFVVGDTRFRFFEVRVSYTGFRGLVLRYGVYRTRFWVSGSGLAYGVSRLVVSRTGFHCPELRVWGFEVHGFGFRFSRFVVFEIWGFRYG